jgi:hypothetical protein
MHPYICPCHRRRLWVILLSKNKSKSKNVPNTLQMMEDEQEMSGGCVRGSGGV